MEVHGIVSIWLGNMETQDQLDVYMEVTYDDKILSRIKEEVKLKKSYNSIVLIYNFQYDNAVSNFEGFDFVTATSYL
ncbi:hypothetical protein [Bacillus sp. TH12]|uniref:hypothetical protein n=1 Tax=Bacillus sp. TH12 TaxID=2796378 RepID=UPI001911EEAA|nr:hypothetical protein [Bacillus sp. TH12]MBK5506062.1 hypothetical protein [Bacillus sp. TH12]